MSCLCNDLSPKSTVWMQCPAYAMTSVPTSQYGCRYGCKVGVRMSMKSLKPGIEVPLIGQHDYDEADCIWTM